MKSRLRFGGPGSLVAAYLALALVLALLPARLGLSFHQAQFSGNAWQLVLIGLAVDTPYVIATYVLANGTVLLLLRAIRRRWPGQRALAVLIVAATSAGFLFVVIGTIAAAEFKLERGLYPTTFDLRVGASDRAYLFSAFGTFFLARFLWAWLLSLAGFIALSVGFLSRMTRAPSQSRARELGISALALGSMALAGFGLHRASPHLFSSIANWRVVESPFPTFVKSLGSSHENVRFGFIALIDELGSPENERATGARILGFSPNVAPKLASTAKPASCAPHPLAEPLSDLGKKGDGRNAALASDVVRILDGLSAELVRGRSRLRIWHLSLESMRADDLSSLNPNAPKNLAPVLDGLYDAAAAPAPRVIAARQMFQAGVRTSQGLAASLCGLGTMPFGLSFARDIGLVPFRCLPDVLKDAGFSLNFYYGSNPAFDNMLPFLHYHGFDHLMTERDYVEQIPHKGWAVPDRIVLSQAFADSIARPAGESQYNLVMTLSNHHPFDRPEDMPAEVEERVRSAVASTGRQVGADDMKRLDTFSYSDHALGGMLAVLEASETAADSLIVIHGDHSTGDYVLWTDAGKARDEHRAALSRIPFLVVLPKALVAASENADKVRELVAELNVLLATHPLSQNDIPRMLVSLLSHSRGFEALPAAFRWHNLGGQALSPHFRAEALPDATVLGIDASTRLFWLDDKGLLVDPDEPASSVFDVEGARRVTPTLRPAVAVLSAFMRGYAHHCWEWQSIRGVR